MTDLDYLTPTERADALAREDYAAERAADDTYYEGLAIALGLWER